MSWLGSLVAPATKSASALGKEEAPSVPAVPETVIYIKNLVFALFKNQSENYNGSHLFFHLTAREKEFDCSTGCPF